MSATFLRRSDAVYQALLRTIRAPSTPREAEDVLQRVRAAARVACFAHTGRYADGAIENIAWAVGRDLETLVPPASDVAPRDTRPGRRTHGVLHVATRLLRTGGHTRLLESWIRNDTTRVHSVALTDQRVADVPAFMHDAVAASRGTIVDLGGARGLLVAAAALRARARAAGHPVVLHAHQFDPTPVVAFATAGGPPVALVNHADHMFWLGSSVADTVVSVREFATDLTARRRSPAAQHLLPIPLKPLEALPSRREARARIGISEDDLVLLTIGAEYKFTPTPTHDFFRAARAILSARPAAGMHVVGMTREQFAARWGAHAADARIRFHGVVPDPSDLQAAADVFLEPFPYGSLTALLESVGFGACPVLMFAPGPQLDVSDDPGLKHAARRIATQAEYVAWVVRLIDDAGLRSALAARAQRDTASAHGGDEWREHLRRLYEFLRDREHRSAPLAVEPPAQDDADLRRAAWDETLFRAQPLAHLGAGGASRVAHIGWLLRASARSGDTRLHHRHVRTWLAVLRAHLAGHVPE